MWPRQLFIHGWSHLFFIFVKELAKHFQTISSLATWPNEHRLHLTTIPVLWFLHLVYLHEHKNIYNQMFSNRLYHNNSKPSIPVDADH